MTSRLRNLILLAGVVAASTLTIGGLPSQAALADDTPAGTYEGTERYTFGDSEEFVQDRGHYVICGGDDCTVEVFLVQSELISAKVVPNGSATTDVAEGGDICEQQIWAQDHPNAEAPVAGQEGYYSYPAHVTVEHSNGTLTVHGSQGPPSTFDCGGITYETAPETYDFVGTLVGSELFPEPTDAPTGVGSTEPSYWVSTFLPLTPESPSVLSGLPTIAEAITPERVGVAVTGAIVLALLMAFPSRLLSGVRDRLVERLKAWLAKRRAARAAAGGTPVPVSKPARARKPFEGWLLALAGLLIASVIAVFVDPRAGFDAGTLRLLGSVFVAFLAEVALGWFVLIFVVRRTNPGTAAWFTFKPWLLLAVVGAVLFARLTGLQPGIAFGAVAAVAFAAILNDRDRARFTFVGLAYAFGLALVAWVGYSLLAGTVESNPEAWLLFAQESLAAATVAGISLLPLLLIPVRGMPGFEIFGWNRVVWTVSYLLGLVAFLLVLLPLPTSWREVAISFWAWLGLFVLYALAATAVWLVVMKPWKPAPAEMPKAEVVSAKS